MKQHPLTNRINKRTFIVRISEGIATSSEAKNSYPNELSSDIHLKKSLFLNAKKDQNKNNWCCPCPPWYEQYNACDFYCLNYYGCDSNSGSGSNCNASCERECKSGKDRIWRFRTTNDHDPWRGNGEFFPVAIWANDVSYTIVNGNPVFSGNPLGHVVKGTTTGVSDNNSWYTPNYNLITWDKQGDGNRMKIIWFEQDGGSTLKLNAGLEFKVDGSSSVEFGVDYSVQQGDDKVGEEIIEYCDGLKTSFTHTPGGGLTFQMSKLD